MMSKNESNKSNWRGLMSTTATAKKDQVVKDPSDFTEQSEEEETDCHIDSDKEPKKKIDQDQKKILYQDQENKIDKSNQTESEEKKSNSLTANMHFSMTIVSSFVTATVVTVIFRVALPPDNHRNSAIIPKEVLQWSVDLHSVNKSVELLYHDFQAANFSLQELQQKYDSMLQTCSLIDSNIKNISLSLDKKLAIGHSGVMAILTAFNKTTKERNLILQNRMESLSTNQTELENTQTETKKELSTSLKEIGTKLVGMDNSQSELAKQIAIFAETKEQTQLSTDYSWREIVMAVICGLLLEVPITIIVIKWCFSSHDDYSDQPQKPTVNRNNSSGGQLHHSPINRQNTSVNRLMNDGTGKELKRGVTVLSCDSGTLSKSHALVSELVRGQTVQRAQVSRVEDLMTTGVTTLVIFVIPFNERNVILEEPGLLQGERNIKIVNYLLNRAVDVLVIYQGDVESQKLPANVLYHPHLTSAERHPTLRQLSMRGRFMSINNNFTTHQKQCIQEAINRA